MDGQNEQFEGWITVEQAAELLDVTTRQAHRYAERGRIETRKAGRRLMFRRADVDDLARDLGVINKPRAKPPAKLELMPAPEVLAYMRERDQRVDELQEKLNQAMLRIGQLQGELETSRYLLEDSQHIKQELQNAQRQIEALARERDELRQEAEQLRALPWWRRLFG